MNPNFSFLNHCTIKYYWRNPGELTARFPLWGRAGSLPMHAGSSTRPVLLQALQLLNGQETNTIKQWGSKIPSFWWWGQNRRKGIWPSTSLLKLTISALSLGSLKFPCGKFQTYPKVERLVWWNPEPLTRDNCQYLANPLTPPPTFYPARLL